jgi:hypothetical protein
LTASTTLGKTGIKSPGLHGCVREFLGIAFCEARSNLNQEIGI